ncbi:hypothetical protein Tco_0923733 [Tanacetum coccineum]|uniref:Reverse transcriptase domain-containing protein n=1 Tax=Tanacetum coccineum TaxID=301880 RepID=A0ABQ5D888_9ASTR
MANTDNTTRPREALVARQCSYKEFMSCQPINFKGTEGAIGLIRWFERTEPVFSRSNCTEDCKVKILLIGTLNEEALPCSQRIPKRNVTKPSAYCTPELPMVEYGIAKSTMDFIIKTAQNINTDMTHLRSLTIALPNPHHFIPTERQIYFWKGWERTAYHWLESHTIQLYASIKAAPFESFDRDKLNFVEEPVEIMDEKLATANKVILLYNQVRWNSKRGPEFTWDREDQIHAKYPHLFSNTTPASN